MVFFKFGFKSVLVTITIVMALITISEMVFIYRTDRFQVFKDEKIPVSRSLSSADFALSPTESAVIASFSRSSPEKIDIQPVKTEKYVFWQDGMFLYQRERSDSRDVAPYALTGFVKEINGQDFELSPSRESTSSGQRAKIKLLEQYGEVGRIRKEKGRVLYTEKMSLDDMKINDRVEARSLKPISENYFSTTQIFVILEK